MSVLKTSSKKKGPKYLRWLHVSKEFILACVGIPEEDKAYVEQFLAGHAYGDASMAPYTLGLKRRRLEPDPSLCDCVKLVRETWFKWAGIIKQAKLTEFERLEAVRMILGVLILQKGKCSLTQDELREAAEDALKWTRWDENNRVAARMRNLLEYKSWLKAVASGIGHEEAAKQYDALVHKASV